MSGNTLDLGAEVRDLRRRLGMLEAVFHGRTVTGPRADALITMYLDAHKLPRGASSELLRAACRQIYVLDVVTLLALGRAVHDDYPWRPFLALLDRCTDAGVDGAADARAYLLQLASDLLELMGLGVLQPRDLMGSIRIQEAVSAISP